MSKNHYRPTTHLQGQRVVTNPIDEVSDITQTDAKESEVKPEPVKAVIGTVTDCLKLRVRKQPNTKAEVLCEIDALSEVQINKSQSTEEFYKVTTSAGVEGFCMKKYIAVKH